MEYNPTKGKIYYQKYKKISNMYRLKYLKCYNILETPYLYEGIIFVIE